MVTQALRDEVYSEGTGEAYLKLLTLRKRDGTVLFRFTSDHVITSSGGEVFTPLAFQAVTPDRADGRQPQGRIRLDNVNQATIATLRGLQDFPTIDMALVRASDPDTIEQQFLNLEMTALDVDATTIVGTVRQHDLDHEPFPARNFDASWRGVWDT